MRSGHIAKLISLICIPITIALGMKYSAADADQATYLPHPPPASATLIIRTKDAQSALATIKKAQAMYDEGIDATILIEGHGVQLVTNRQNTPDKAVVRSALQSYEGAIHVCPICMKKYGVWRSTIPLQVTTTSSPLIMVLHTSRFVE